MSFALVAHTGVQEAGGLGSITTPAINTTGANLIVVSSGDYLGNGTNVAPTDSNGNTYTLRQTATGSIAAQTQIWECQNPTVGAGHTITRVGNYQCLFVSAWSGAAATSQYDKGSSGTSVSTSVQPGSITPANANSLVIASLGSDTTTSSTASIDSGFTITDQFAPVGGVSEGGGQAYLIQSAAAAVNPTWSGLTGAGDLTACIVAYIAAAGGGFTAVNRRTLGPRVGSRSSY